MKKRKQNDTKLSEIRETEATRKAVFGERLQTLLSEKKKKNKTL